MVSKLLYFDTETTGLSNDHGIIEIALIVEIDNEVKDELLLKMKPTGKKCSKEALAVTGYTISEIQALPPWEEQFPKLLAFLGKYIDRFNKEDKFIAAGHNVKFDLRMLNGYFKAMKNNFLYSYIDSKRVIDTLPLAKDLQNRGLMPKLENNKLGTLCEYFGIDLTNAHTALADIVATRELYLKMEQLVLDKELDK